MSGMAQQRGGAARQHEGCGVRGAAAGERRSSPRHMSALCSSLCSSLSTSFRRSSLEAARRWSSEGCSAYVAGAKEDDVCRRR
jgi:hypothetical protein